MVIHEDDNICKLWDFEPGALEESGSGENFWETQGFGMEVFEAGWHTYGHLLTIIKGMEERLAGYDRRQ